jgi:hypothetical protein
LHPIAQIFYPMLFQIVHISHLILLCSFLVGKGDGLPTVLAIGQYIQDTANQDFILVILGALAMLSPPTHAARGSDERDAMPPPLLV